MFFTSTTSSNPTLRLSISSSGLDRSIAYGPGSVINGTLFLETGLPISVQQISIVFQGQVHHHQQPTSSLFSVTEHIQLNQQNTGNASENDSTVVSAGSHMHLFAIQLPRMNYPPTIAETTFPKASHIDYTLQAFLEYPSIPTLSSEKIHLTYLPLVTENHDHDSKTTKNLQHTLTTHPNIDTSIQIHASMAKSAYCLGEQCEIQLTTNNTTNDKLNYIYVTFMTRLTTQQQVAEHINHQQTIPTSIPKQTQGHVSCVIVPIEQHCLPTFDYSHDGITVSADQHIIIGLTHYQTNTSNSLSLPITVTTMPSDTKKRSTPLMIIQHDTTTTQQQQQPYFISSQMVSPIPTGTSRNNLPGDDDDDQYSVSPSGSFILDDICTTTAGQTSATSSPQQHHLMVPSLQ